MVAPSATSTRSASTRRLDDLPVDAVGRIASVYADPQAANSVADGFEIIRDGALYVVGSFLSAPAITPSMAAASATERVIGPTWSSVSASGKTP